MVLLWVVSMAAILAIALTVRASERKPVEAAGTSPSPSVPASSSPTTTPAGGGQGGTACTPSGTSLAITAPVGASGSGFNVSCLAVAANTSFTVTFTNDDTGVPHNFAIYTADPLKDSAAKLLGGATSATQTVVGPGSTSYKVGGLAPGTYFFRCDVHPTTMTGTFTVK